MKKLFLLVQVALVFGASMHASEVEEVFSFRPDWSDEKSEKDTNDDFYIVTHKDVASYSVQQELKDVIHDKKNAALDKAKKQLRDEVSKSLNKQADLLEQKFNEWLEENLAALVDAALAKTGKAVSSGSSRLYEGAKKRALKGWDWITGVKQKKALKEEEKQEKLIDAISLETALDLH